MVQRGLLLALGCVAFLPIGVLVVRSATGVRIDPIVDLRFAVPALVLLSSGLVFLLGIGWVHRRLVPLEKLLDPSRQRRPRGAEKASDGPVPGFGDLASSFDLTAAQLSNQFKTLTTITEIDQAIHAALDTRTAIEAFLSRIRDIYPCDTAAVTLVKPGRARSLQTWVSSEVGGDVECFEGEGFATDESLLLAHPDHLLIDPREYAEGCLSPLAQRGIQSCLVFPVVVRQHRLRPCAAS